MKTYRVIYQLQMEIDIEAGSAESAIRQAKEINFNDGEWQEIWTSGPYVDFEDLHNEMSNDLIHQMLHGNEEEV